MPAPIHGRLGAVSLAATTDTTAYSVPSGRIATVSVNFCNRTTSAIQIRLAHVDGAIGAVANEDYLEYDFTLPANGGTLERTGICMAATHTLLARASAIGVSVVVSGIEEDA